MNKNQYVNSILKKLLVTDRMKKRIRDDLMTEMEALEEQGLSFEEIMRQKGVPELVAKEFNDNSSDPETQRQYHLQKGLKITAVVLLVSAAFLVLTGTALQYVPFWFLSPFAEDENVALIGGTDGPTTILVTSHLNTAPLAVWLLILGCVLLVFCLAALTFYWILRKKY